MKRVSTSALATMLVLFFLSTVSLFSPAYGSLTTVNFENGLTSPTRPGGIAVGDYYASLGMTSPNLRFHLSTYPGNVPFNFEDDWGAVVDYGVLHTATGFIEFANPVGYVEIDARAQSSFNLNGAEPYTWSITAFDNTGMQVAFASEMYGFDFAGEPNPPNTEPYPLAILSLKVEVTGEISRLEIDTGGVKTGFDTIRYESVSTVPIPGALYLFAPGLAALVVIRRRFKK